MLTTNLSTRPFYNERAVHLVLAFLGLIAIAVMAAGVVRLVDLSRVHTALSVAAERAEREAAEISTETTVIQQGISDAELESLALAAEEANRLIDQRVFSWTEFFNTIERTLPANVMLTAVRPDHAADGVSLTVGVIGRGVQDIEEFIERLEATGAFTEVLARQEELTSEGMYRAQLRGRLVSLEGTPPSDGAPES